MLHIQCLERLGFDGGVLGRCFLESLCFFTIDAQSSLWRRPGDLGGDDGGKVESDRTEYRSFCSRGLMKFEVPFLQLQCPHCSMKTLGPNLDLISLFLKPPLCFRWGLLFGESCHGRRSFDEGVEDLSSGLCLFRNVHH